MLCFEHPQCEDAVAIMYAADLFEAVNADRFEFRGAVTGIVKLGERDAGHSICVVVAHVFHPADDCNERRIAGILSFAHLHGSACDCTILAGTSMRMCGSPSVPWHRG